LLGATARLPLGAFLDDIADAHRGEDLEIRVTVTAPEGDNHVPQVWRAPELLHGLGNIIENAADFAKSLVAVNAGWDEQYLYISVHDDGPGFAPEIFEALGEPYITSRPGHHALGETDIGPQGSLSQHEGMGLGFFIAKILLEQTGGLVNAENPDAGGALVSVRWPRGVIGQRPSVRRRREMPGRASPTTGAH